MIQVTVDGKERPVAINELTLDGLTVDDGCSLRHTVEVLNGLKEYHGERLTLAVDEHGCLRAELEII